MVCIAAGAGVLALPTAFTTGGWVMGLTILVGSALCTLYAALLLGECSEATDSYLPTYGSIGKAAFGFKGEVIANTTVVSPSIPHTHTKSLNGNFAARTPI